MPRSDGRGWSKTVGEIPLTAEHESIAGAEASAGNPAQAMALIQAI